MANIILNVRDPKDKTKIVKQLTADGYNLMMGTVDDFLEIIDLDKIDDEKEVIKMVLTSYKQFKPLLKDIFPELTDDDYRNISVNDLVFVIPQIGTSIISGFKNLKN